MASGVLGTLKYIIGANTTDLERGLKKSEGQVNSFSRNIQSGVTKAMTKVGGAVAAAFAADKIIQFGKEALKLSAQAEGVEAAFNSLNDPFLLSDLRNAVQGTVSDLELMKQAVRANNFKVPLNQLATFFEFATKRAAQTGESVDYLVNSIIDGIGRKSTLVMDNLGISATELQEEIKKVGDFGQASGNIIERELGKMGDVALTTAQRMQQLNVQLANTQKDVGDKLVPVFLKLASAANAALETIDWLFFTSEADEYFKEVEAGSKRFEKALKENMDGVYESLTPEQQLEAAKKDFADFTKSIEKDIAKTEKELSWAEDGKFGYGVDMAGYSVESLTERLESQNRALQGAEVRFNALLRSLGLIKTETTEVGTTTEEWESQLKDLNRQIDEAAQSINDDLNASIARIGREGTGDLFGGTKIAIGDFEVDPEGMQSFDEDIMGIDDSVNQNLLPSLTMFEDRMNNIQVLGGLLSNIFDDMAADDPFAAMIESIKGLLAQLAQAAALSLILSLLTGGISNFGKIFGGMTGFSIPKFAEGGITSGPTLAMVGDNPSGKEAIIPLEKMGQIFGGMQGGGTGGGRLTATVSGTDLKFVLDRTNQDFNRFN